MIAVAFQSPDRTLTDDEVKEAAQYFASIKPAVWNKVVETTMVPKTYVGEGNMRFASEGNAKEPIGRRIIEVPENEEGAKVRDPHSPFIAYVPPGSIKAGEARTAVGRDRERRRKPRESRVRADHRAQPT